MKPIEPGCTAICIHPSAMNEECEIIRIVKRKAFFRWTDGEVSFHDGTADCWLCYFVDGSEGIYKSAYLIRKDDDKQTQRTRVREIGHA